MSNLTEVTDTLWQKFCKFWHREFPVKVKHLAYMTFIAVVLIGANQYQVDALSEARFKSVCEARVEGRSDFRDVLAYIVDLSDVVGDEENEKAERYTASRIQYMDARIPELDPEECQ